MKKLFFLFSMTILFQNCTSDSSQKYIPKDLQKLTLQQRFENAKAMKLISPYAIFKDEFGDTLSKELRARLNKNELFTEQYVNEKGEISEIIVREFQTIDEEILAVQEKALLTDWYPAPEIIEVSCEVKKRILGDVYKLDQGARTGENPNADDHLLSVVVSLIQQCGFPSKQEVGETGMLAIFLVFQHSNIKVMSEYYNLLKKATERGEIKESSFALMTDRLLMWGGRKQIYGSQISNGELYPIRDAHNVNQRRAEIGLQPIEEYLAHFDLKFEPEKSEN